MDAFLFRLELLFKLIVLFFYVVFVPIVVVSIVFAPLEETVVKKNALKAHLISYYY